MDEEAVATIWGSNASTWTKRVTAGGDRIRDLFDGPEFYDRFIPELHDKYVIDLGCGEGRTSREAARRGAQVVAVDLADELITLARQQDDTDRLGIDYRCESFTRLSSVADGTFDMAISMMAFMDGPNFKEAAAETFRVLKAGGTFHFSVLHPCFRSKDAFWTKRDGKLFRCVSGYFDETPYTEQLPFASTPDSPVFAHRFPNRMETYVNGLADAGFQIVAMREPKPAPGTAVPQNFFIVPTHLFLGARKPA